MGHKWWKLQATVSTLRVVDIRCLFSTLKGASKIPMRQSMLKVTLSVTHVALTE